MNNKRIVLLHGWGASARKLESLKIQLENLGWDVLLPELPGFEAPDPDKPWMLDDYVDHVVKLANKKWPNERYYIFGHSFGGRIALKMSIDNPENIDGLVLCASGGISRSSAAKRVIFMLLAKIGKVFLLLPPLAKLFRKLIYKLAREYDYEKSNNVMKKTMQNIIEEDLKEIAPKVNTRTLILWGKKDEMTPYEDSLFLNKTIVDSKLIGFPEQGHKLPYNLPTEISKEIDKWTL